MSELSKATGKICSRTVKDSTGHRIIGEGEVITNTILEQARRAGVVEQVLACAGLTTISLPESVHQETQTEKQEPSHSWQPSLPPAAEKVIKEEE